MPKNSRKREAQSGDGGGPRIPPWLQDAAFADEEVRRYLWAASRCGLEVSHWARTTLNAAARAILEVDEDG